MAVFPGICIMLMVLSATCWATGCAVKPRPQLRQL